MAIDDSEGSGLSNGAILGIVLGALAFVCIKLGKSTNTKHPAVKCEEPNGNVKGCQ